MSPTHTQKGSRRYRYYVSAALTQGRAAEAGSIARVPAAEIEDAVVAQLSKGNASRDRADLIASRLQSVVVRQGLLEIELQRGELIQLPWSPTNGQRRREIVVPEGHPSEQRRPARSEDRTRILHAISQGRSWLQELVSGEVDDPAALAAREGRTERAIRSTLALAFLSPRLITTIIDGRLPRGMGIARLADLPSSWAEQHQALAI